MRYPLPLIFLIARLITDHPIISFIPSETSFLSPRDPRVALTKSRCRRNENVQEEEEEAVEKQKRKRRKPNGETRESVARRWERGPRRGRFSVPSAPAESAKPPGVRSVFPQSSSRTRTRTAVWRPPLVYILSPEDTRRRLAPPSTRNLACATSDREFIVSSAIIHIRGRSRVTRVLHDSIPDDSTRLGGASCPAKRK